MLTRDCNAAALFVLWEISTPFVYMRWLLHTLGKSKSREYLINGFAMMGAFFLCRNVAGFSKLPTEEVFLSEERGTIVLCVVRFELSGAIYACIMHYFENRCFYFFCSHVNF